MFIKSLELSNYRNYEKLAIQFDKGTNILYGDNAQGKTNILESIYICGTTKSHRGSKDKEIIRLSENEAHIRLYVERENNISKIDVHLKKNKPKGIAINGIPIKKSVELFGIVNMIFFSPEDLNIIKNGPSERRRFLDLELCQLDKLYVHYLSNYNKIIQQRNELLKQITFNRSLLDTLNMWDIQLIEYGKEIIKSRIKFIEKLNEIISNTHHNLTGGNESLIIKYEPNVSCDEFEYKLKKNVDRDIIGKNTSVGPHRDDFSFYISEMDLRKYGSQGQQRTAALSLKLAEIEIVRKIVKEDPILLLDDVLSELDRKRQNYLLNSIDRIQTIVTCTGLEEFIKHRFNINSTYEIVKGTIKSKSE